MRIAALIALSLAVATGFTAAREPHLTVPTQQPFVVRGSNFVAGESLRVDVIGKAQHTKTARATTTGKFVARFGMIALGRCGSYTVKVRGSRGSAAALRFVGECPAE